MTKVQIEKRDPFVTLSLSWEEALLYVGNVAQICLKVKSEPVLRISCLNHIALCQLPTKQMRFNRMRYT